VPAKYHIHTHPTPPRFRPEGKLGIVDWREDCSSCKNCVKKGCVYGLYRDEYDALHDQPGYLDYIYQCKGCLTCIQNCTKNILTRVINPEYERLGDAYFTPDIIQTTWTQAETGGVPVSGCGYGGPFSGKGFDSMWTDMSEIVRPTRDGIHGREYISTAVDIGRKLNRLSFRNMEMRDNPPPLIQSPLPLMFDLVPPQWHRGKVVSSVATAASELGLFALVTDEQLADPSLGKHTSLIPVMTPAAALPAAAGNAAMVVVPDGNKVLDIAAAVKKENPRRIVAVRLPADGNAAQRSLVLAQQGIELINLVFDKHGKESAPSNPRHMRDVIREVHRALVKDGIRDQITVMSSGGVALPEHMAKAIICGVDLVAIDIPLFIAMECRLCGDCTRGEPCPVDLETIDEKYAVQRVVNLMGAWHSQLLEMLGAMGIREARRLRGETGRCMFFEDLEREAFGRIFGKRKEN
jgi:ferredoxin